MLKDLFKKKSKPIYDYRDALKRLADACAKCTAYSMIFDSVYYNQKKGCFIVHFECAIKEPIRTHPGKYCYIVKRDEKLQGKNLDDLLEFAITYTRYQNAFIKIPVDNLPEGITMKVANIKHKISK